jgi:hypothetical protein
LELHARRWAAQSRIVEQAHLCTGLFDLDPVLARHLEDAYREQDMDAFYAAFAELLEAVSEVTKERSREAW